MPSVVVIHPVKSGVRYKKAVRDRGHRLISVYAFNEELLEKRRPDHADGDDISLCARDPEGVLERLEPYRDDVRAVLSGNDSPADLADQLAHALGLPGNCVELARTRNHKDVMRRVAEQAELRIPRYRLVGSAADIPVAAREVGFPAIAKHTSKGGSHGAALLADEAALTGLRRLETIDHFREPVRRWLVEQYVRSRKIAVNTMSYGGAHWLDATFDHRHLNDAVPGIDPSAENPTWWMYHQWIGRLPELSCVRVSETPRTWATYRGK
ncbi:6-carboxytetrahydropterin synthase [Streptomyces sp. WAC 06783]|uniref:6-carboxytetrahydropterin synthase n=1 Tax=Streptomyces sp. WAC 06783 TaxID=2203211 RepID=UPI0021AD78DF|nr:6-carboxytetrahydropterin synthase [Streptomyces sp. WAC 06783]